MGGRRTKKVLLVCGTGVEGRKLARERYEYMEGTSDGATFERSSELEAAIIIVREDCHNHLIMWRCLVVGQGRKFIGVLL